MLLLPMLLAVAHVSELALLLWSPMLCLMGPAGWACPVWWRPCRSIPMHVFSAQPLNPKPLNPSPAVCQAVLKGFIQPVRSPERRVERVPRFGTRSRNGSQGCCGHASHHPRGNVPGAVIGEQGFGLLCRCKPGAPWF